LNENWDDKYEYLRDAVFLHHNKDYWEFLIRDVWRLDKMCRVVDFGCGYGRMGLVLLSLLPEGSTYAGIDTSEVLLAKGRKIWADLPYPAEFIQGDVRDVPVDDNRFDIAFSHTVLMHISRPEEAIAEMVRVTKHGGMVITCDANRNAANAMFHIHETHELESTPLSLFQKINAEVRRQTGADYNIGIKTPVLLHEAGLRNIDCRISDAVRLLIPPLDTEEKVKLHKALCDEGFGYQPEDEEEISRWREKLIEWGISAQDAAREVEREINRDFLHKGKAYRTVYPGLLTFSYGTVEKPHHK
jgi:ubiquinone/menaquinone biosynthesis C-methylase UbiE